MLALSLVIMSRFCFSLHSHIYDNLCSKGSEYLDCDSTLDSSHHWGGYHTEYNKLMPTCNGYAGVNLAKCSEHE